MASKPAIIPVKLPTSQYNIIIQPGLLDQIPAALAPLNPSRRAAIVTDSHIAPLYLDRLRNSLESAGYSIAASIIPAGEDHKTLSDLLPTYDALLSARIDRQTPILALGGGVVGDMTGFIAATLLRGVPFVQIPTSLLAMVDASVGGKTGVNHPVGKNLIGAFHQPIAVLIDPNVLKTLPAAELRSGLAECIKHDIIRDADGFSRLEKEIPRALALDIDYLAELVAHNVAIKAAVVQSDPFENADRAHLNFGHTFGHAIETVSHYQYSHGQCVALGMVAAARLAVALNMLDQASAKRIIDLIARAELPVGSMTLDPQAVADTMAFDKKVKSGKLRFILPDRIGHVVIRDDVPADLVLQIVKSLQK